MLQSTPNQRITRACRTTTTVAKNREVASILRSNEVQEHAVCQNHDKQALAVIGRDGKMLQSITL